MKVPEAATGVIHIGGGLGQEASHYAARRLPVLWVEPLAENVAVIRRKTRPWPEQQVVEALVSDRDGTDVDFHVTHAPDGRSTSSSLLPLAEHRRRFPHVREAETRRMRTVSLPTLLARHASPGDHLVLDVQGAELMVLRGAEPILPRFRSVAVEVSTIELYAGQPLAREVGQWLTARGFQFHTWDATRHVWHTDYLFTRKEDRRGLGSRNHNGTATDTDALAKRGLT